MTTEVGPHAHQPSEEEKRRAAYITQVIERQGRKREWVASQMGISYSYLHKMLRGVKEFSERHFQRAADVLGVPGVAEAVVTTTKHGLVLFLPAGAHRVPPDSDEYAFFVERAWKDAWIRENRSAVLEAAATRAWDAHEAAAR